MGLHTFTYPLNSKVGQLGNNTMCISTFTARVGEIIGFISHVHCVEFVQSALKKTV